MRRIRQFRQNDRLGDVHRDAPDAPQVPDALFVAHVRPGRVEFQQFLLQPGDRAFRYIPQFVDDAGRERAFVRFRVRFPPMFGDKAADRA